MGKARTRDKPLKFEQAIEKVEAIIDQIDSGEVELEQCLTQYEAGVKLLNRCYSILSAAERKIAELTTDAQGQLKIVETSDRNDK